MSVSGNTVDFTGGTLKTGEDFQLNLRMTPTPGMGGVAYGRVVGTTTWQGPYTITGP
jgi:hypothetical protein